MLCVFKARCALLQYNFNMNGSENDPYESGQKSQRSEQGAADWQLYNHITVFYKKTYDKVINKLRSRECI